MLRSAETLREMLRQEAEHAPLSCFGYMLDVADDPAATLLALELALHAWHDIACSATANRSSNPRKAARCMLDHLCGPDKMGGYREHINPHLFFAALHAAGLIGDLNLGCSLSQSNGVVVLSLNPTPILAAVPLDKWKAALTDAAKAAL